LILNKDQCLDQSSFRNIFKEQIRKLVIQNEDKRRCYGSLIEYTKTIYLSLLTLLENVEHLTMVENEIHVYPALSLRYFPSTCFLNSNLTYLSVNVVEFSDCLRLLDGRLNQLTSFLVQFYLMENDSSIISNTVLNLKCFSLIYDGLMMDLMMRFVHFFNV